MIIHGRFPFSYPYHYSSLQIVRYSVVTYRKARNCGCRTQVRSPAKSTASKYSLPGGLQNHVLDLSKSKVVSTTCRKAKVVPQPSENKILDKLPRTEKGISATPARDDPGSRKSLKTRLFQPPIMYFLSAILPSRRMHFCPNHPFITA